MKPEILTAALLLAVSFTHTAEADGISEPGTEVIVERTITPDAGVPVQFKDMRGCRYTGELTKPGDAWLAQVDRQSCPGANGDVIKVVKLVVPLGAMKRAVCSGTRLGMFMLTERLPTGVQKPDAAALASHAVDAAYSCK